MNISLKFRVVGTLCVLSTLFLSFSNNFPTGNTGAPGENTCQSCHSNNGGFTGEITTSGIPSSMMGGDVLNIESLVTVLSGSPVRAGFSMLALDENDNNAGEWLSGDGGFNSGSSGREYWGHSPAQSFGGQSSVNWLADWEAPNVTTDVTFYYCAVIANGSGVGGDRVECDEVTVSITGAAALEVNVVNQVDVTCPGGSNGAALAEAINGTAPYTFEWDNGETAAFANMLDSGLHEVTVTDDNGNTASASVFIDEPDAIGIDALLTEPLCNGDANGSIDAVAFGGAGGFTCDWEGLGSGCFQDQLAAGDYEITVTDASGCTKAFVIELEEQDALNLIITSTDASSPAAMDGTATVNPSGGTGAYEYEWSTGASTQTITGLTAGTYMVTVIDDNSCEATASVMVSGGPCSLTASPMITPVSCFGDSTGMIGLAIMGGNMPIDFAWSDGSTAVNLTNVPSGQYSVTITDALDCEVILPTLNISQPDSLAVNLVDFNNVACVGDTNGALMVSTTGGVGDYVLTWSTGATNDTIVTMAMDTLINLADTLMNLQSGLYTYNLVDGNGCVANGFYEVIAEDSIAPTLVLQQGVVELDANGFAPAAEFSLVDAGSTDNCMIASVSLTAGPFSCADIGINSYPVFATDSNNNFSSGMASIQVVEYVPPIINCANSGVVTNSCNPISYVIPVATDNCDTPEINLVSGPASGSLFAEGTTLVTYSATDACGNSSTCSFEVEVTFDLTADISIVDASCSTSTGAINVEASGGTAPYTILPFGAMQDGLTSGGYTIEVIDAAGCSISEFVTIGTTDGPSITTLTSTADDCSSTAVGTILISLSDGEAPYVTSINGGPTFTMGTDTTLVGLAAGTYELSVVDQNGCEVVGQVEIDMPALPVIEVPIIELACADEVATVDFTVDYPDFIFEGIPSELSAGSYDFTVIDEVTGCSITETLEVTAPTELIIEDLVTTATSLCDLSTSDIIATVEGGVLPYVVSINPAGTHIDGTYEVNVIDANECSVSAVFQLEGLEQPTELAFSVMSTYDCDGNGFIDVETTGGCPPYMIEPDLLGMQVPGNYNITITDQLGTTIDTTYTLVPGTDLVLAITNATIQNSTANIPGGVVVDVQSSSEPISYMWTDSLGVVVGTEAMVVYEGPGELTLTLTDSEGCSIIETYFVDFVSSVLDNDQLATQVKVYPNPATDRIHLLIDGDLPEQLVIHNIEGELIARHQSISSTMTLDIEDFTPGLYFIKYNFKDKVLVQEFLKL